MTQGLQHLGPRKHERSPVPRPLFRAFRRGAAAQNRAMQPENDRSRAIVDRVVAWHNRHPLAQRITAAQVQGVGVVSLPFAVQGARVAPLPVAAEDRAADGLPRVSPGPAPAILPEGATAAVDVALADTGAEVELITDAGLSVFSPDAAAVPAAVDAAPDAAGHGSTLIERAAQSAATGASALAAGNAAAPEPAAVTRGRVEPEMADPLVLQRQVTLPDRLPESRWRRAWARLRGRPDFRALFSEDFIAPLRPARVGRWAAEHGVAEWPLDAGAPLRQVALDASLQQGGDPAPELELHLISAAVELGGRRTRLLVSPAPGGPIVGPRHYSRGRVAGAAAAPLSLVLIGAFVGVVGARVPASSIDPPSAAASAASGVHAGAAARAPRPAPAPRISVAAASAAPPPPVAIAAPSSSPAAPQQPDAARVAAVAEAAASRPVSVDPRLGRIDLQPLVPRLVQTERFHPRPAASAAGSAPVVAVPAKAYALATPPQADRAKSERAAAQLHAVALLQRLPMKAELMHAGGAWRAVFWPFATAVDAERVRLALAGKGLRTEVIEF